MFLYFLPFILRESVKVERRELEFVVEVESDIVSCEGIASHGFAGPLDYGERSLYCFCRSILIWTTGMAFITWLQVEEKKQAAADVLDQYSKFVMACIGNQVRPCDLRLHLMKVVKPLNLWFLYSELTLKWGLVFLF